MKFFSISPGSFKLVLVVLFAGLLTAAIQIPARGGAETSLLFPPPPDFIPPGYLPAADSFEIEDFKRSLRQIKKVRRRFPGFIKAFELELQLYTHELDEERLIEKIKTAPEQQLSAEKIIIFLQVVRPGAEKSVQLLEWALKNEYNSAAIQLKYIELLKKTGARRAAFIAAREALKEFPEANKINLAAGRLALEKNRLKMAQKLLRKYVENRPGDSAGYRQLARLYRQQSKNDIARDYYSRYRALEPEAESWKKFVN